MNVSDVIFVPPASEEYSSVKSAGYLVLDTIDDDDRASLFVLERVDGSVLNTVATEEVSDGIFKVHIVKLVFSPETRSKCANRWSHLPLLSKDGSKLVTGNAETEYPMVRVFCSVEDAAFSTGSLAKDIFLYLFAKCKARIVKYLDGKNCLYPKHDGNMTLRGRLIDHFFGQRSVDGDVNLKVISSIMVGREMFVVSKLLEDITENAKDPVTPTLILECLRLQGRLVVPFPFPIVEEGNPLKVDRGRPMRWFEYLFGPVNGTIGTVHESEGFDEVKHFIETFMSSSDSASDDITAKAILREYFHSIFKLPRGSMVFYFTSDSSRM